MSRSFDWDYLIGQVENHYLYNPITEDLIEALEIGKKLDDEQLIPHKNYGKATQTFTNENTKVLLLHNGSVWIETDLKGLSSNVGETVILQGFGVCVIHSLAHVGNSKIRLYMERIA